jgi:hypothetical protein
VDDKTVPAAPTKRYQPIVRLESQRFCTAVYVICRVASLLFMYAVHCAGRAVKNRILRLYVNRVFSLINGVF